MVKWKQFVLNLILILFIIVSNISVVQADYVVVDWGDVIKIKSILNYRKPGDQAPFFFSDTHIELYLGENPPKELNDSYDRLLTMFQAFREKVIGMREGQTREFTLSYIDAGITNQSSILYNADLIYSVLFEEMLYDAAYDPKFELTLTHPLVLFPSLVLLFGSVFLIANGYHKPLIERLMRTGSSKCHNCSNPTNLICGNPSCRKFVCSNCFSKQGCPSCHGNKLIERKK